MRYIFSVRALGLFSGQSRSEVEFRFNPTGEAECSLELTICIIFPNKLRHLLARLFFTQAILRRHTKEEMAALAQLVESWYPPPQIGYHCLHSSAE